MKNPNWIIYHGTPAISHGTLVCRGTQFEEHWVKLHGHPYDSDQTYLSETLMSLGVVMVQLKAHEIPRTITSLSYCEVYGEPLIRLPLCRETSVSLTADVIFSSFDSHDSSDAFHLSQNLS